jgi:hypothetical protein
VAQPSEAAEVVEPAEIAEPPADLVEPAQAIEAGEAPEAGQVAAGDVSERVGLAEPADVAAPAEIAEPADLAERAEAAETTEVVERAEVPQPVEADAHAAAPVHDEPVQHFEPVDPVEVIQEAPATRERWGRAETAAAETTDGAARAPFATRKVFEIEAQPVPAAPTRRPLRTPAILLAAAVLVAVLVGYPLYTHSGKKQGTETFGPTPLPSQTASSAEGQLGLQAEKQGDDLLVEWNRAAPLLVGASRGMLIIRDATGHQTSILVDGNLLRDGSIVYRTMQKDVSLRLVIVGQSGTELGESMTTYPRRSDSEKEKK